MKSKQLWLTNIYAAGNVREKQIAVTKIHNLTFLNNRIYRKDNGNCNLTDMTVNKLYEAAKRAQSVS